MYALVFFKIRRAVNIQLKNFELLLETNKKTRVSVVIVPPSIIAYYVKHTEQDSMPDG